MGKLGKTYQKVASAWSANNAVPVVSRHSQIIPMMEINGSEATNVPAAGAFLPI